MAIKRVRKATLTPAERLEASLREKVTLDVPRLADEATRSKRDRPLGLFVIRESDEHDSNLFDGLRESSYVRYRGTRAVEEIRRVGMAPMSGSGGFYVTTRRKGIKRRVFVPVRKIVEGQTTAYLFCWRGYYHLWSQSSAAKLGRGRNTNEFTKILKDLLEELRPMALLAGNFSRLIRSQWQGNYLLTGLQNNVNVVIAGDTTFPMVGERAHEGLMMFSMFSMVTSMERNFIVQRMLTGRVTQCRKGEWPLGGRAVPFGYRLDTQSKRLVPDPDAAEDVRTVMRALLSDAPPRQLALELSRTRLRRGRRINGKWQKVRPKDMVSCQHLLTSLWAWAPLYVTGQYLLRYTNPFPGIDELAGAPVAYFAQDDENTGDTDGGGSGDDSGGHGAYDDGYDDDLDDFDDDFANDLDTMLRQVPDLESTHMQDPGELQLLLEPGVPDGGWADAELLKAFARKARERSQFLLSATGQTLRPLAPAIVTAAHDAELLADIAPARLGHRSSRTNHRINSGRSKDEVAPFAGRSFIDGSWYYEFAVAARRTYKLIRYPLATMAAVARELDRDIALAEYLDDDLDAYDDIDDLDVGYNLDTIEGHPHRYRVDPLDLEGVL